MMYVRKQKSALRLLAFALVASALCWPALALADRALTPGEEQSLKAMARSLDSDYASAESLLGRLGFPPLGMLTNDWRDLRGWPLERQLEAAWRAAEQAQLGSGEKFLAAFARQASRFNDAVRSDERLKSYFPEDRDKPLPQEQLKPFEFVRPQGGLQMKPLPINVSVIIAAVASHASSFPGGAVSLAGRCCGLEERLASERLFEANDFKGFLEYAVKHGKVPPEMLERLARILQLGVQHNLALADATDLSPFREALERLAMQPDKLRAQRVADLEIVEESDKVSNKGIHAALLAELQILAADRVKPKPQERSLIITLEHRVRAGQAWPGPQDPPDPDLLSMQQPLPKVTPPAPAGAAMDFGDLKDRWFEFESYGSPGAGGGGGGPDWKRSPSAPAPPVRPPAARTFVSMRAMAGGKGGVIFGSEVSAQDDIALPVAVSWRSFEASFDSEGGSAKDESNSPLANDTQGMFLFRLADGSTVASPPVNAEDALAAVQLVFTGVWGAAAPAEEGEGIGLVGLASGGWQRFRVENGMVVNAEDQASASFYVHPAISHLGLGRVVMVTDAFPFLRPLPMILENRARISTDKGAFDEFNRWLAQDNGQYKITDVPLEVVRADTLIISVRRADKNPGTWPDDLRDHIFLGMQTFDGEVPRTESEEDPPFYRIAPVLIELSSDFARLNEFARTFALLRWAQQSGAIWSGDLAVTETARAWGTLFVTADDRLVFGPDPYEAAFLLADEVDAAGRAILDRDNAPNGLKDLHASVTAHRRQLIAFGAIEYLASKALIFYFSTEDAANLHELETRVQKLSFESFITDNEAEHDKLQKQIKEIKSQRSSIRSRSGITADEEAFSLRRKHLYEQMPLSGSAELVAEELVQQNPDVVDHRAELRQIRDSLRPKVEELGEQLWQLRQLRDDESAEIERRRYFATEELRTETEADFEALTDAWWDDDNEEVEKLSQRLLQSLPELEPGTLETVIDEKQKDLEDLKVRLDPIQAELDGGAIPGFAEWYELQASAFRPFLRFSLSTYGE